jgi:deoxyribonuclease V
MRKCALDQNRIQICSRFAELQSEPKEPVMIAALDVSYDRDLAIAAAVLFEKWASAEPSAEVGRTFNSMAPYRPGRFFERELPPLLGLLNQLPLKPETIVIDGYVWLDEQQRPGLGAHLYEALDRSAMVIGVAKTRFSTATAAIEIHRGTSRVPLFVTAAGVDPNFAAKCIRSMYGGHRIPTMLRRADQLSRGVGAKA